MAVTLTPRSVGLMVAVAVASGWMGATVTQNGASPQQSRSFTGRPIGSSTPVPQATRLRERVAEPPQPERGRNPFVFGARVPTRTPSSRSRVDEAPAAVAQPLPQLAPAGPVFRLSGVAADAKDGVT